MDIVYPNAQERIYIPRDLNGAKQKIIAEATHKAKDVQVHWYVDRAYYGSTEDFHSIELGLSVGDHVLYCIDDRGEEQKVSFEVLSR
jgi:penicillin-binding protein 1C